MAKGKVKEPTVREQALEMVYTACLNGMDKAEAPLTKEGMLIDFMGEQFVLKVIQKKNPVYQEDIKGNFEVAEMSEAEEMVEEEDFEDHSDEVELAV